MASKVLTTNTQVRKKGKSYPAYGFMKIKIKGDGSWQGVLVNPAKNLTLVNCSSENNLAQGVCELAKGVSVD